MYEKKIQYIPYLKEDVKYILVYKKWLLESEFLRKHLILKLFCLVNTKR